MLRFFKEMNLVCPVPATVSAWVVVSSRYRLTLHHVEQSTLLAPINIDLRLLHLSQHQWIPDSARPEYTHLAPVRGT